MSYNWLHFPICTPRELMTALAVLCLAGCCCRAIEDWPAVEGVVVNADTGEPIADAIVIANWSGTGGYSQTVCFHSEGVRSDRQGRFVLPAWRNEGPFNKTSNQHYIETAYRAGYREVQGKERDRLLMVPFTGTREERLEYLRKLAANACDISAGLSRRNLYPFFEALYLEAKELSKTEDELEKLERFRYWAAMQAVETREDMSGKEYEERIKQFLEKNLK